MLRVKTGVHVIEPLGAIVISGAINCQCAVKPEPYTVIEKVEFFHSSNLQTICRPELWEPFENLLIGVLEQFGEVEKQLQTSSSSNDTI